MKNKKLITATVTALLAPTLLNSQLVLAEAITTPTETATTSETNQSVPAKSNETASSQVGDNSKVNDNASEVPVESNKNQTNTSDTNATTASKDTDAVKEPKKVGIVDPSEGNVVINALPTLSVPKGSAFDPMNGVSAYDNISKKDVTSEVKMITQYQIEGPNGQVSFDTVQGVDTTKEGNYFITYTVETENGKANFTRWIMVIGTQHGTYSVSVPNLTLPKNADLASAIEGNAIVKDSDGTLIAVKDAKLFIGGQHSTSEVGTFTVEVGVISKYNTITTTTTTVTIVDPIKITAADKVLFVGDTFDAKKYATASGLDGNGAPISLPVEVVSNNVDTAKVGTYTVEYKATDGFGNTATKTIKITVSEKPIAKASITAEDHTMHVGDKLTKDMVMDWATFKNIDGYKYGFEVVGESIKVTGLGDKLVEPGVHKIRYYATNGQETVETFITLTVKTSSGNTGGDGNKGNGDKGNGISGNVTNTDTTTKKEPVKEIKKQTEKKLPETGSKENGMALSSIGLTLIASVYFMKKRKENEFDLY